VTDKHSLGTRARCSQHASAALLAALLETERENKEGRPPRAALTKQQNV